MSMRMRYLLALIILLTGSKSAVLATNEINSLGRTMMGRTLSLATGNEGANYYAFGLAISNSAATEGLAIEVMASKGSVENLQRLTAGQIDLCLAQSDIAFNCYKGRGQFNKPTTNLIAIAPIYTEVVHIMVRKRLQVRRIQDFSGKRVALGEQGSGTEVISRRVLDAAGISISEIQPFYLDLVSALDALKKDSVDIVFVASGYPLEALESVLKSEEAWLYEPNIDVCERLVSEDPCFVISTIPQLTYPGQYEDVSTIGIRALLLGRSDSKESVSHALAKAVATCRNGTNGRYRLPKADTGWNMGTVVPLGLGALRYYEETGVVRRIAIKKCMGYVIGFLIVIGLILVLARFREIRRRARSDGAAIALAASFLFAVWGIGSFVLFIAEHKINDSYGTFYLSLWATLINWMNFGTKEPYTLGGRVAATIMLVLGAGGVYWFGRNVWKGLKRMKPKYRDHYVVINWGTKGSTLLKQLRNDDFKNKRDIVVVLNVSPEDASKFLDGDGVAYLNGGVTKATMTDAGVPSAHSVIILADEAGSPEASDAKTILAILAVRQQPGENGLPVPIVAEIRDPEKVNLANYAGVLDNGSVEVVSSEKLGASLLCQAAVTPGVTHLYEDLLSFAEDSNEIYGREVSPKMAGNRFSDICRFAMEGRGKAGGIIPVGIKRGKDTYLNPSDEKIGPIQAGDTLFAICDNAEGLDRLMKDVVRGG